MDDYDDDAQLEAMDAAAERARDLEREAYKIRIREEARRKVAREQRATQDRPHSVRLDEFLARTYEDPHYRVSHLWPTGGRVLLTAQWKAGKTTLTGNLLRSLVDGDPFLDRFDVRPGARVVLIDNELDPRTIHQWLTDQGIVNQEAVTLVSLRGKVSTFDILDDDIRAEWAADLAGADVIIFDCLRPVLDALGLDENREAGRFLVPFDALLDQCGATEAVIVHHMGHSGERSRGDSRLQDWPDALWKLVRDKDDEDDQLDDPTGSRYFSAFGRDVNVAQAELTYDHQTRHLTLGETAKTRKQSTEHRKIIKADQAVLQVVTDQPGINKTGIRAASRLLGITHNPDIDSAVERLIATGRLTRRKVGKSHMHYPGDEPDTPYLPTMPNDAQGATGAYVPNALSKGTYVNTTDHDPAQPEQPGHDQTTTCPHGMTNGNQPDPFVNGRLSCPRCATEERAS